MDPFINDVVDTDSLPRVEEVKFKHIERLYWRVLQWRLLIAFLAVTIFAVGALILSEIYTPFVLITTPVLLIIIFTFFYWLSKKSFLNKGYAVREKDILYRTGWLLRRVSVCPFNRIQHCSIHAGPIEKKLGL